MAEDEQIGKNLARIRGALSQKDLAAEMRRHGFKWSQATVWSIEKGERPLRLAEADVVAQILDESVTVLLSDDAGMALTMLLKAAVEPLVQVEELAAKSFEDQKSLAILARAIDDETRQIALRDSPIAAAWRGMVTVLASWDALARKSAQIDGPDAFDGMRELYEFVAFWRDEIRRFKPPGGEGDGERQAEA